jgi:hypothetical protein
MSTIKVDTLQTRAGTTAAVTGAGFVATDQIRGNTAANSVTVVAEGGTVTTNLQQGLVKVWVDLDGTGTVSIDNSFNVASVADDGTGDYTFTFSNNFANANFAGGGICGNRTLTVFQARSTSTTQNYTQDHNDGTNEADKLTTLLLCGDLA